MIGKYDNLLQYMKQFEFKQLPTYREICKDLGIRHPQQAKNSINQLIALGKLMINEQGVVISCREAGLDFFIEENKRLKQEIIKKDKIINNAIKILNAN